MATFTIVQPIEITYRVEAATRAEALAIAGRNRDEYTMAHYVDAARNVLVLEPRSIKDRITER